VSVCHTSEPCKNGCTDRDAVWVEDSGGPREPCVGWGSRSPCEEEAILRRATICKVQGHSTVICAKTAEPIEMLFWLWAQMDRSNRVRWGSRDAEGRCYLNQFWGKIAINWLCVNDSD